MIAFGIAGLALALQAAQLRPARLSLPPDSAAAQQSVRLRDGALQGRVFGSDSDGPMPQIAIRFYKKGDVAPKAMSPVKMTTTGTFSLPNVTLGVWALEVWALGYAETRVAITAGNSGKPDVLVRLEAEPVSLDDLCPGNCPELPIRGRIRCRSSGGGVPPELRVAVVDAEAGPPAGANPVKPNGEFSIKAWRGPDWRIVVLQRDDLIESLPVRANRDTVRIDPLLISCVP